MNIKHTIGLILLAALVAFISCAGPVVSPTPSISSTEVAGQEFIQKILKSVEGSSGWMPPLPPAGGEKPRVLTQEEKDRVMGIANSVPQVIVTKQDKDVVSMDTGYQWVGWNGNADGESFLNYGAVENGTAKLDDKGDTWYPGVGYRFNSQFGEYAAGINVAVNLQTGKVIFLQGFASFPIPRKIP